MQIYKFKETAAVCSERTLTDVSLCPNTRQNFLGTLPVSLGVHFILCDFICCSFVCLNWPDAVQILGLC